MKILKGRIMTELFMGFDVETYGVENKFYSGGFWWIDKHGRKFWKYFTEAEKMRQFILRKKWRNYTVVATNLSFDFTVLFWNTEYWNNFKIVMRGSRIMLADYRFKSRNGRIKFIDTMNYIPFGVSKLGEIVGVNKLDSPSFWVYSESGKVIDTPKPSSYDEAKELEIYNKQDCMISCLFMKFLQEGINKFGGNLKMTSASTSLDTWRRNYQPFDIVKEEYQLQEDIKPFIYEGYYGGRTEVFERGLIKDMYYYDINSLYPSVMCLAYPNPNTVFKEYKPSVKNILHKEGVTKCTVYCPYMKYPLLPYRNDGKLMFPTGLFTGVWNNVELRKAIEIGYEIREVHQQLSYDSVFYPFRKYVNELYDLRLKYREEGSNMELVVKLLMNSLYGKFAQRHLQDYKVVDEEFLDEEDLKKIFEGELEFDMIDGKIIMKKDKICNSVFTFPILSSYVTSYARLLMYGYILKYNPVYTDTDSLICREQIPESKDLGKMKLEAYVKEGYIVKPKMYMVHTDSKKKPLWVKAKGVKKPNEEDFMDILKGNKVMKDKFSTLRESIRRHIQPNTILEISKQLDLEDNKRIWNKSFNMYELQQSEPIKIIEEEMVKND